MPVYNYDELIDQSICLKCKHLVARTIIPVDFEEFDINYDELKEQIETEDGEDIDSEPLIMVHNTCSILNMDLGHIVLTCNRFERKNELFREKNPFIS